MEKELEQTLESDVAPVKQEAPPTKYELFMPERTSTRQSTYSQQPRPTVDRMETDVGSPPVEPKSHFLDGKGNLFRATFVTTACATQLLSQAGLGVVMIPLHVIGESLGTDDNGQMSWMAASYGWDAVNHGGATGRFIWSKTLVDNWYLCHDRYKHWYRLLQDTYRV